MDYSKEEIIRLAHQALVQTERYQEKSGYTDGENYRVECVLVQGNALNLKEILAYAFVDDEGITLHIRPKNNALGFETISLQHYDSAIFDYDSDFFAKLEKGYVVLESTMDFHYAAWITVEEMVGQENNLEENVLYMKGLQEYLCYCKRMGITKERLVKGYQYNGLDIVAHCTKRGTGVMDKRGVKSPEI